MSTGPWAITGHCVQHVPRPLGSGRGVGRNRETRRGSGRSWNGPEERRVLCVTEHSDMPSKTAASISGSLRSTIRTVTRDPAIPPSASRTCSRSNVVSCQSPSTGWRMTKVGRSAWFTTAPETLPSSIERTPVSPREPMTNIAAPRLPRCRGSSSKRVRLPGQRPARPPNPPPSRYELPGPRCADLLRQLTDPAPRS